MVHDRRRRMAVLLASSASSPASSTMLFGATTPPSLAITGNGCFGTLGLPRLTAGAAHIGNFALHLDLLAARPGAPCVFALSAGQQNRAIGGGCILQVADPIVPIAALADASGFSSTKLGVPVMPVLRGATAYAQAVVVDPQGPVLGLALSNGLALRFGD
jgi:hypothetical protein